MDMIRTILKQFFYFDHQILRTSLIPNFSKPIVCSYSEHRGRPCIVSYVHIGRLGSFADDSFR